MSKQVLKMDDEVVVIAGADKGKRGKIIAAVSSKNAVVVEGVNIVKRHTKPNQQAGIEGGIIDKEAPIHASNVMLASKFDAKKAAKK